MDVQLVSDNHAATGRTMVVDVRGADSSETHAVVEYMRKKWGAPDRSQDVWGDGDFPDADGVARWTFRFGVE